MIGSIGRFIGAVALCVMVPILTPFILYLLFTGGLK